jgi:hypothetical protein
VGSLSSVGAKISSAKSLVPSRPFRDSPTTFPSCKETRWLTSACPLSPSAPATRVFFIYTPCKDDPPAKGCPQGSQFLARHLLQDVSPN